MTETLVSWFALIFAQESNFREAVFGLSDIIFTIIAGLFVFLKIIIPWHRKKRSNQDTVQVEITVPNIETIEDKLNELINKHKIKARTIANESEQENNKIFLETSSAAKILHSISSMRHLLFDESIEESQLPDGIEILDDQEDTGDFMIIRQNNRNPLLLIQTYKDYVGEFAKEVPDNPLLLSIFPLIVILFFFALCWAFVGVLFSIPVLIFFGVPLVTTPAVNMLFLSFSIPLTLLSLYFKFCYRSYIFIDLKRKMFKKTYFRKYGFENFQSIHDIQPNFEIGNNRYDGISINGIRLLKGRHIESAGGSNEFRHLADHIRTALGMPVELAPGVFVEPPRNDGDD